MAFFSFKSDRFLEAQNLSLVLQQVMVVGVLAIGQTLVILTAGIDLSVRDGDGARPDRDDEARGGERRRIRSSRSGSGSSRASPSGF